MVVVSGPRVGPRRVRVGLVVWVAGPGETVERLRSLRFAVGSSSSSSDLEADEAAEWPLKDKITYEQKHIIGNIME